MDIGSYISLFFYKNKAVVLLGLGSFEVVYQFVVIDQVQGELYLLGNIIFFNFNLVSDDGLLCSMIQDCYGLLVIDVVKMFEDYVYEVKEVIG